MRTDTWTNVEGKTTSYFRGRKLHARTLKLPKGYKGAVLSKSEKILPLAPRPGEEEEEEDDDEIEPEVKIMEEQSSFEEIVVWGHEATMDEADPYVRGVEEWIGFAGAVSFCVVWRG